MSENSLRSVLERPLAKLAEEWVSEDANPGASAEYEQGWADARSLCAEQLGATFRAALAATQEPQPSMEEMGMGDLAWSLAKQAIVEKWDDAKLGPAIAKFAIDWHAERAAGAPAASCLCKEASDGSPILDMQCPIHLEERIEALESKLAAAPRPELAPAQRMHDAGCDIGLCLASCGCWCHNSQWAGTYRPKASPDREAPPDLAAALREALDRLEVDANRPTKNTELKTVRHGMKLAANRLRKALAQLKVQR